MNTCGTDNPEISVLIQKQLRYTGSIKSEMSRDSKNAFLHCGDVLAHADKKSQQARKQIDKQARGILVPTCVVSPGRGQGGIAHDVDCLLGEIIVHLLVTHK